MAPKTLDPKYEIAIATPEDMEEVMYVLEDAYANDEVWWHMFEKCDKKEVHKWIMEVVMPRWLMPDITTYKVVEKSSGKIVGWTALASPWKYHTSTSPKPMTEDDKHHALSEDLPPWMPKDISMEGLGEFFRMLNGAFQYGYDPEKDYHRKGTMIHPDFQKQGLATALTAHTNAVADKTGDRTWAPARQTSHKMFKTMGFVDIGEVDHHTERWGGTRKNSITAIVRRDVAN
ncbi:hypothetical protein B0J14DRAFT_41301 [Halenospora varia]|nr:hypothetical protein B0J14DRAFT_41301 [Halenospora varia]